MGTTDALFAMSRLYQEGRHHAFAAGLLSRGLAQTLALHAGLPPHAPVQAVAEGLITRGREDLAQSLRAIARNAESVSSEQELQQLATRAAALRQRLHPSKPAAPAPTAASPEKT